jgi:uroporphyrinogen-III synthase
MLILVTRPEPDASRTAARLNEMDHQALIEPVLAFERVENPQLPDGSFDAIAVTSANAMRAVGDLAALKHLHAVPVFAVGARTAEAVKAAGFEKVTYSNGDATQLAVLMRERLVPGAHILHLSGEHRAQEFSTLLATANIKAATLVLYRMRAASEFSQAAAKAMAEGRVQAVLHYSPRSAALFVTLMQRGGLADKLSDLRHLCLSDAVAMPLLAAGLRAEAARKPDENTLLSMI